jgi:hypothetical protein
MDKTREKWVCGFRCIRFGLIAATVVLLMGICNIAGAFEIPTGIEDIELRFDNTVKYNLGLRVEDHSKAILSSPNYDDGDRNFDKGRIMTNRVDILSEFDLRYKKNYGFRFSGTFWYDEAYEHLEDRSLATSNHIKYGEQVLGLSEKSRHNLLGPWGEVLDAFVFGKVDLGPVPVNIKVGRHTLYWGESMFTNQGISYSQGPIDFSKALAVPGSEIKEIFRPLFQASAVAQLTNTLSISGYQQFQWEPYRVSESGGYFDPVDLFLKGADSMILGPGFFLSHGNDAKPDALKNWGVALNWSPGWLQGTAGLFYRRFTDMIPSQLNLDFASQQYFVTYGNNIDLYGVSLSRKIMGISIGAEFSYRHNMPLVSGAALIFPGMPVPHAGETLGARGDTYHGVINALGLLKKTPFWEGGSWVVELNWMGYARVNQGNNLFNGRSSYHAIDHVDKNAVGLNVNFSPQWFQIFPGMDLTAPLNWGGGIWNNSPVAAGACKGAGSYSVGLSLDVYQKYTFSLAYNAYYGQFHINRATGAIVTASDSSGYALLRDRSWIGFTAKTTF